MLNIDINMLQSALSAIPVSQLPYSDWIAVGMAIKDAGLPCDIWDDWSKPDTRYKPGECDKKWRSFGQTSSNPVRLGTIYHMAMTRGWAPWDQPLKWNDPLYPDYTPRIINKDQPTDSTPETPVEMLTKYLQSIYHPDDLVSYVTTDSYADADGKWHPRTGTCRRMSDLLESLTKHPDDIGATIGDWPLEAGAWIRINPVDGTGVHNCNITKFNYTLIESDTLSIAEQDRIYRALNLPIAAMVHSGGKSLHAIVHIDAPDETTYTKRVAFLHDYLSRHHFTVDRSNKNPSRLSRLPGVTRKGQLQALLAYDIGAKNWDEWMMSLVDIASRDLDNSNSPLPPICSLSQYTTPPSPPPVLIDGILRCGHKMLVAGASKAGKSFLLMELCISIAEGLPWLGHACKKGRVLYVNFEIDEASAINRFFAIYDAMGITPTYQSDILIWHMRGHAMPLDALVPELIYRVKRDHLDAVIIDPIYKVVTGDENNATDMGKFCNQFDKICAGLGCAAIYCHHHSKGAQGGKRSMDRSSGSGVFARDPDALLDLIQLVIDDKVDIPAPRATAWRIESTLREFADIDPINCWYTYPIHMIDNDQLCGYSPAGSIANARSKSNKYSTRDERLHLFQDAYDLCKTDNSTVTVTNLAKELDVSARTVRERVKEFDDYFCLDRGIVTVKNTDTAV